MKGCILPLPKKGDLGLAKNYRGITLTSIAAKIYNALLRNRIEPKIDNILRKNQNGFRRNRSTTSQILTIRRILVNAHKTEYMCYNQTGDISTLEGTPLKLVDKFTYLGSGVESTEKDIETRLTKAWTAINRLSIIWKSDLTDKMKRSFFQAAVTSILLYGCTTWTLTKRLEKLDGNYTRMLRAILNKSWQQHPTRHQLYGHLPPSRKLFKLDEPDMQDTAGEAEMNS